MRSENNISFNWRKWQKPTRYLTGIYTSTAHITINSRTHWGMNWIVILTIATINTLPRLWNTYASFVQRPFTAFWSGHSYCQGDYLSDYYWSNGNRPYLFGQNKNAYSQVYCRDATVLLQKRIVSGRIQPSAWQEDILPCRYPPFFFSGKPGYYWEKPL